MCACGVSMNYELRAFKLYPVKKNLFRCRWWPSSSTCSARPYLNSVHQISSLRLWFRVELQLLLRLRQLESDESCCRRRCLYVRDRWIHRWVGFPFPLIIHIVDPSVVESICSVRRLASSSLCSIKSILRCRCSHEFQFPPAISTHPCPYWAEGRDGAANPRVLFRPSLRLPLRR